MKLEEFVHEPPQTDVGFSQLTAKHTSVRKRTQEPELEQMTCDDI